MKASAQAHPIQGLIKYHGMRDAGLRLPFHDSISVCTAPLYTRTTVEFSSDFKEDEFSINGKVVTHLREQQRIQIILDQLRTWAGSTLHCRMASMNSFPTNIGLGASASAFASLTLAAAAALELALDMTTLSRVARLGAGSACRALVGGFARWLAGETDETSYAYQIAGPKSLPMSMVIAVVERFKYTEDAHREALTSPFFAARVAHVQSVVEDAEAAIRAGELARLLHLAERDTLNLHAVTMSGESGLILWSPDTLRVIDLIKELREQGVSLWFSIDTGASVYVNTYPEHVQLVEAHVRKLGLPTYTCSVGDAAQLVQEHLF